MEGPTVLLRIHVDSIVFNLHLQYIHAAFTLHYCIQSVHFARVYYILISIVLHCLNVALLFVFMW
jgi:hypothetical protein